MLKNVIGFLMIDGCLCLLMLWTMPWTEGNDSTMSRLFISQIVLLPILLITLFFWLKVQQVKREKCIQKRNDDF